jgi:hypothetical protein
MDSNTMNKNIFETLGSDSETEQVTTVVAPSTSPVSDSEPVHKIKKTNIKPFQGQEVFELRTLDEDYPELGSTPKAKIKSKGLKAKKTNITSFVVASSYAETRQNRRRNQNFTNGDDPRSQAFAKMEDKETVAKTLTCTRACNNVKRSSPDKDFGVCYREKCSFAHCLDELNDPMCGFDATCRFRWGKPRRDGTINHSAMCMFRHSDEVREDWIKRTGRSLPDLPETDEKTRQPTARGNTGHKTQVKTTQVKTTQVKTTQVKTTQVKTTPERNKYAPSPKTQPTKGWFNTTNPVPVSTPDTHHPTPRPDAPRKAIVSHLDVKTIQKPTSPACKQLDFSDDSRQSRSRHRSRRNRRRSRSRSPMCSYSRSPSPVSQVIRVPTKELAAIAIKAAFDRGIYNLQVLVE